MRKLFFTLALASLAGAASAQSLSLGTVNKSMVPQLPSLNKQMKMATTAAKGPKKIVSNGVYYQPQGGLFRGYDMYTGNGYYAITYSVPPMTDITFKNMSTGASTWTVNSTEMEADENGNYVTQYFPSGGFYGPVVTVGKNSWSFGDNNLYALRLGYTQYQYPLVITDSISNLGLVSPSAAYEYNGTYYNNIQTWGFLDTDNLFGSGTYTSSSSGTVYTATATEQVFPALSSPLYVEAVSVDGVTASQPIPEGKTLTAYITNVTEESGTYSDGTAYTRKVPGDQILQTLTATAADTLDFKTSYTRNSKKLTTGTVIFKSKKQDEIFGEVTEPFVIPAGQEFAVVVSGLDQDGVDFGIEGRNIEDEYDYANGYIVFTTDGSNYTRMTFEDRIAVNLSLYGMFEKIEVLPNGLYENEPENLEYNKIRVSADGTATYEGTTEEFAGVPVFTATSFYDEQGSANYDIVDCPDWIHPSVNTASYDSYGLNVLLLNFDALPSGVTGRNAVLTIEGRGGIEANLNICIAQGDAALAVEGVKVDEKKSADSRMFNLAGQQVSKSFKGIVVKDGKKFMNK